jgi:hypothetical protein
MEITVFKRGDLNVDTSDVPCFYNEARHGHQSKRLREKVKPKTVMEGDKTYIQPVCWIPGRDAGKGQEARGGSQT